MIGYLRQGWLSITLLGLGLMQSSYAAERLLAEPVKACIASHNVDLTDAIRFRYAQCLGWQLCAPTWGNVANSHELGPAECDAPTMLLSRPGGPAPLSEPTCLSAYRPLIVKPFTSGDPDDIRILVKKLYLQEEGTSRLEGDVEVQQKERIINAETAYIYRDPKTKKITKIEFVDGVRYLEPGRLMIAKRAMINPDTRAGTIEEVLYRFEMERHGARVGAWGRASKVERFANQDYQLQNATYSTCAPTDKAWQIEAEEITLDHEQDSGVARNARLRIYDLPVLYAPYLTFPTSKKRKTGFLMPIFGTSNIGGFEYAQPYYLNLAPNYDATLIPHLYTKRGVMVGGQFRYLTHSASGIFNGQILPNDYAFRNFLNNNKLSYPQLSKVSSTRWSVQVLDNRTLLPDLNLGINFQQVSDDYFLQDFSSSLPVLTERQLLHEATLSYRIPHWFFRGMLQSYQTLRPIDATPILNPYQHLPQLTAYGNYDNLFLNSQFTFLGQFDLFKWNNNTYYVPQGPRLHLNPVLAFPARRPWGYLTPSIELVENYYQVSSDNYFSLNNSNPLNFYIFPRWPLLPSNATQLNRTIPRFSIDGGLYFDRSTLINGDTMMQTLEPRLYYLYVPYVNQTAVPVYDSGYMIFTTNQLFRNNRFSGFDRIGDANQLTYALTSRWLTADTGVERASLTIGQIAYFANRRVQLCQSSEGPCFDSPLTLGYLPQNTGVSPLATHGMYRISPNWSFTGDYVWDMPKNRTNNANVNLRYQPGVNRIINLGYAYLTNGDITELNYKRINAAANNQIEANALDQITASYAWPLNDRWSSLGAYHYNISKGYEMASFLGVQYDTCCWGARLMGGRTFQSLTSLSRPKYNNNIYFQILLKGLGSVGNSDPEATIHSYIPTYRDAFHRE